jgi:hypothetical protein
MTTLHHADALKQRKTPTTLQTQQHPPYFSSPPFLHGRLAREKVLEQAPDQRVADLGPINEETCCGGACQQFRPSELDDEEKLTQVAEDTGNKDWCPTPNYDIKPKPSPITTTSS